MTATIYLWCYPGYDGAPGWTHRLFSRPGVNIMVRPKIATPRAATSNPPDWAGGLPATSDANGIAHQIAIWCRDRMLNLIANGLTQGRPNLMLQQWGYEVQEPGQEYSDLPVGPVELVPSLERNYRDAVTIGALAANEAAEINGPYHAQGIATCYTLTKAIADALPAWYTALGVTEDYQPDVGHQDFERPIDIQLALPESTGYWVAAINDARYSTQALDAAGNTLEDRWTAAEDVNGDPVDDPNLSQGSFGAANRVWSTWLVSLSRDMVAHAASEAFVNAFDDAGIPLSATSVYDISLASQANPAPGRKAYQQWYTPTSLGTLTHGQIIANQFKPANYGAASGVTEWLTALGLTTAGSTQADLRQIWLAVVEQRIIAHQAVDSEVPLVVLVPPVGFSQYLSNVDGGVTHTISASDLLAMYQMCVSYGVDKFVQWVDDNMPIGSYDGMADVIDALEDSGGEDHVAVICTPGEAVFTTGGDAVVIDSGISITATASITGATVTLGSGYVSGDVMAATDMHGITSAYVAPVLTASGTATDAQYQEWAATVTFDNPSGSREDGTVTATFAATDGSNEASDTRDIAVSDSSAAPVVTFSTSSVTHLTTDASTRLDASVTVTDADSSRLVGMTFTIGDGYVQGEDRLVYVNDGSAILGINDSWNDAAGRLTLSGNVPPATFQSAGRRVYYMNISSDPTVGDRTITAAAIDPGALEGSDTITLSVMSAMDDDSPDLVYAFTARLATDVGLGVRAASEVSLSLGVGQ